MNSYELRQQRRRERLLARVERLRGEGNARINRARAMADVIPFGQPILVGHHSEKSDRNYRAKIRGNFEKGFETLKAADQAAQRAASVGTGGISSDDPDAVAKLKTDLEKCEKMQALMVAANKAIRKGDDTALRALGLSNARIAQLKEPDFIGRIGFADFQTKNNGANIRRMKARIAELERNATRENKETKRQDGLRIVENADENRLQLFFPSKPSEAARSILKSHGFRWSPMAGAWQLHLSNRAKWSAETAIAAIDKLGT
jgi:hypothetical protein